MKAEKIAAATLKLTTKSTENNVNKGKQGPKLFMQNTYIHTYKKTGRTSLVLRQRQQQASTTKKNNQKGTKVMHKDRLGKTHTPPRT